MSSKEKHPPKWADKFLEWYCRPQLIEEIQGDLHEAYHNRCDRFGSSVASLLFILDVVRSMSSDTVQIPEYSPITSIAMLRNNVIIFLRKLSRRKAFAAINIAGLATSLAGALLIYLYVSHELSFDKFNEKADRIYRVYCAYAKPGDTIEDFPNTPPNFASATKAEIAGVEQAVRVEEQGDLLVKANQRAFSELHFFRADSGFFDVFSAQFVIGDGLRALSKPYSIVLTKSTAEKYFGSSELALNREVTVEGTEVYNVTAVVNDFPSSSHLLFDALLSTDYVHENLNPGNWLAHNPVTYLLLSPESDVAAVQKNIIRMTERILDPVFKDRFGKSYSEIKSSGGLQEYRLQPLLDVHLYSSHMEGETGNIFYVYIFIAIAVMLVTIACFNYINLATARSAWEARNTGVRKVLGATRSQMYKQFLTESVGTMFLALLLALLISQVVLMLDTAFVRQFIPDKNLGFTPSLTFAAISFAISLISGIIPARILSSFDPIEVLKGQLLRGVKGNTLRQVLVVGQFAGSMALIMCTFLVSRQLDYMSNLALGFDKERLIVIPHIDQLGDKKTTLKNAVEVLGSVQNVSLCYGNLGIPSNGAAFTPVELIEQNRQDLVIGIPIYIGDEDYLKTLGPKLLMGHTFPKDLSKEHQQIILNKSAIYQVGWQNRKEENMIGKMIDVNGRKYELAGIVDDYHFISLRQEIGPMGILSHYWNSYNTLMIRLKPGFNKEAISDLEKVWKMVSSDIPFEFSFVDDNLNHLYASEQGLSTLFTIFAIIAIFIACLGLLGLAMFLAERSIKEISIRKVLGASVQGIVFKLSKNMIALILVSFVVAVPVSWYLMDQWLRTFAYRTPVTAVPFLFAGGATLLVAIGTMSFQTIKAALTNPADTLRHE